MSRALSVFLLLSFALVSCGPNAAKLREVANTEEVSELQKNMYSKLIGPWSPGCEETNYVGIPDILRTYFQRTTESIEIVTETTAIHTLTFFSDTTCTTAIAQAVSNIKMTIVREIPDRPTEFELDIEYIDSEMSVFGIVNVTASNLLQLFNYNDWQDGVPKSVEDREILPLLPPIVTSGEMLYTLFHYRDDAPDRLLFGGEIPDSGMDGKTPQTRHNGYQLRFWGPVTFR